MQLVNRGKLVWWPFALNFLGLVANVALIIFNLKNDRSIIVPVICILLFFVSLYFLLKARKILMKAQELDKPKPFEA